MVFERAVDEYYTRWFAWRPVKLYGPDEWLRQKRTGAFARVVWLRLVWRLRGKPRTYYALFDGEDR